MASIMLSGVGAAIGGMVAGPLGAQIGYGLGAMIGSSFGPSIKYETSGARMAELSVQTSTYGKAIPVLFGQARFAGNIIWSLPIKEREVRSRSSGGGKGGRRAQVTNISYTYSVTLAIAICEGPIDSIVSIWADAKNITAEIKNFRIYNGGEDQLPDPTIETHMGVKKTPAYRGLAYIVIEDFPLGDYGNRIPNFTFEAKRRAKSSTKNEDMAVEDRLEAICMIPGSGEFVYDTEIQYKVKLDNTPAGNVQNGKGQPINMHNLYAKPDSVLALDQLQYTCKNIKWVAPVVGWFCTSLDLANTDIAPGVEFRRNVNTSPDTWQVAGLRRSQAHQITLKNNSPIYGGTTSDESVLRYLDELKNRGVKIMFYPMLFVDLIDKPWRGHMTGKPDEVKNFFRKKGGYNEFILHYARLCRGKVDAFLIGSEFKKITEIVAEDGSYPAVKCLIDLAKEVKGILGPKVKISYAADWSEYHHTSGGWYHMDELWSSEYIDFIGIDTYFPITEKASEYLSEQDILDGWESGEHYHYYYSDKDRNVKRELASRYAIKDIKYWWENFHYNPDRTKTSWVPKSKKIWFTEFGFPSVDGATNEPNVFFDPEAFDGGLPRHSNGREDLFSQRLAINATLKKWQDSEIVEELFLWCWDARPYPSWPALTETWADGYKWSKGHWVNGKFGVSSLADVLAELCLKAGLPNEQFDTSKVEDFIHGFVIDDVVDAIDVINLFAKFYFFDSVEVEGKLRFISPKYQQRYKIDSEDLIYHIKNNLLQITYKEESSLPSKVEVIYVDKNNLYHQNIARVETHHTQTNNSKVINSNLVLTDKSASQKTAKILANAWDTRVLYKFVLPLKYINMKPGDVASLDYKGRTHHIKIHAISVIENKKLEIEGSSASIENLAQDFDLFPEVKEAKAEICEYVSYILDLPQKIGDFHDFYGVYIAVAAKSGKFSPASLLVSSGGSNFDIVNISEESCIGCAHEALKPASANIIDYENSITVTLISGRLFSAKLERLLCGENLAILGEEIIQFSKAKPLGDNCYKLSGLLRGRMGTEHQIGSHKPKERFVLLNDRLTKINTELSDLGVDYHYKLVRNGANYEEGAMQNFSWQGTALKPLSPVHARCKEVSDDEMEICWTRRTRIGGSLRSNVGVLLGEEREEYEVEFIGKDNAKLDLVRTTAARLTCSRVLFSSAFKIKIAQISSFVGAGHKFELTIRPSD